MLAGKIGKGVQATEAAKAAVAKIENAVKREVITPDKLVRTPSSDLYDKSCYMNTEKFWEDNKTASRFLEKYVREYERFNEFGKRRLDAEKAEMFAPLKSYIDKMRKLAEYKENL